MSAPTARPALTEARRERRAARPGYMSAMRALDNPQREAIEAYVVALNHEAAAYRVAARESDTQTPSPGGTAPATPGHQHEGAT